MNGGMYHILGFSEAFVSMLVESIHQLHGSASIVVIGNVRIDSPLDHVPASVTMDLTDHGKWDFSSVLNPLLGVYRPETKRVVYDFFRTRYEVRAEDYARLVHPSAEVAATVALGAGATVQPLSVLAPHSDVGRLVTINRLVSVGHHTVIGDLCTLNPGVNIAGGSRIGEGVTVGMGANVLEGVEIGASSMIGAGALVTKDIPENVVATGAPARVVKSLNTRCSPFSAT